MKVENWCGHDIRFVEKDGEWWAVLEDVCGALGEHVSSYLISSVLGDELVTKVKIDDKWETVTNEIGIYKLIFDSDCIDARKFRRWSATVMQKLRTKVGLKGYEVMRMLEPDTQDAIDHILDTLFWDEEKKMVMQSVTVAGGDVDQIPFV